MPKYNKSITNKKREDNRGTKGGSPESGSNAKALSNKHPSAGDLKPGALQPGQLNAINAYSRVATPAILLNNDSYCNAYTVTHYQLDWNNLFTQMLGEHDGVPMINNKLDVVINKLTRLYYSETSPALIDDVRHAVWDVIEDSGAAFGQACEGIRTWNAYDTKDAYGRSIAEIPNYYEDYLDLTDIDHVYNEFAWHVQGEYDHRDIPLGDVTTLSRMKERFIAPLRNMVYLAPNMLSMLRTLLTGVIKMDAANSDSMRYVVFHNEWSSNNVTLQLMSQDLAACVARIKNRINEYPFIPQILEEVGLRLVSDVDFYDIDQTRSTMTVFYDEGGQLADLLDHGARSARAVTETTPEGGTANINDVQFAFEDNTWFHDTKSLGPEASLPVFTSFEYINLMTLWMGNINPMSTQVFSVYLTAEGDVAYNVVSFYPQILKFTGPVAPENAPGVLMNRIIDHNAMIATVENMDNDEILYIDQNGNHEFSEYCFALGTYLFPREYNSMIREMSAANICFDAAALNAVTDSQNSDFIK